jgi:hypothetical protein
LVKKKRNGKETALFLDPLKKDDSLMTMVRWSDRAAVIEESQWGRKECKNGEKMVALMRAGGEICGSRPCERACFCLVPLFSSRPRPR